MMFLQTMIILNKTNNNDDDITTNNKDNHELMERYLLLFGIVGGILIVISYCCYCYKFKKNNIFIRIIPFPPSPTQSLQPPYDENMNSSSINPPLPPIPPSYFQENITSNNISNAPNAPNDPCNELPSTNIDELPSYTFVTSYSTNNTSQSTIPLINF